MRSFPPLLVIILPQTEFGDGMECSRKDKWEEYPESGQNYFSTHRTYFVWFSPSALPQAESHPILNNIPTLMSIWERAAAQKRGRERALALTPLCKHEVDPT